MNNDLKISVCVITYNHEKYIRQCLLSIINQDVDFDFEVIVGVDFSSDRTLEVVKEVADSSSRVIRVIEYKSNIGGSKNYLNTHRAAKGRYIAHIDGDDYWLPGKLKAQKLFLDSNPKCVAVYSNAIVIEDENIWLGIFNNRQPSVINTHYLLEKGNYLNHSSLIYRAHLRENVLDFPAEFIDYQIHLRLSLYGELGYLNQMLVGYRYTSTSTTTVYSELVRNLYWNALLEVKLKSNTTSFVSATSNFLASIVCGNILKKQFLDTFKWLKIFAVTTPYSFPKILLKGTIISLSRILISGTKRVIRHNSQIVVLFRR